VVQSSRSKARRRSQKLTVLLIGFTRIFYSSFLKLRFSVGGHSKREPPSIELQQAAWYLYDKEHATLVASFSFAFGFFSLLPIFASSVKTKTKKKDIR
jgi:hypothetical protein